MPFPRPLTPCEDPPGQQQAQQQETHAVYSYHSYQQRSEASGQTHGGSYNRASHSSSSADPWRSPTLDVQRGGRQGPPYYQSQADLPPTLHSSHSVHSHTSRTSQYQPSAGPAYPAGHRPSRGDFPTDDYQSSVTMSHTAFDPAISSSHGTMQRHYAGEPATSSRVPHGVSPEIPGLSVKNRERRQIEAPNGTDDRTSPSPTEESSELGFGVKLGGWELWSVHASVSPRV
jgi:hypothetical protein